MMIRSWTKFAGNEIKFWEYKELMRYYGIYVGAA